MEVTRGHLIEVDVILGDAKLFEKLGYSVGRSNSHDPP